MNLPGINNAHPDHIGQYQLISVLGRGGMGIVYLARDTRLDRQVAIKCLRTELFESHYIERFKREALLLAKLNHPNIVQIYDFIESPEQLALVMEYVDGDNLHKRLREQLVPMQQRLRWLTQITQGLAVAHDAGIIHRDLKAENILLNKRNDAKISDLGIAKSQDFNATLTDHVAGSYCSMSPEQAMGEPLDFKSDLFSLGILAYQLLCGAHPFGDTSNKLQVMQRIISHPPIPPQKHNPSLPVEICNLLGQLLSKNPENRPDNTGWVAAEFERLSLVSIDEHWGEDETQALTNNSVLADLPNKDRKLHNTGEHPTFDTRFTKLENPNSNKSSTVFLFFRKYWGVAVSAAATLLILATFVFWKLQPAPPKYIAVLQPHITSTDMQESQQELVKAAIYDAIQQSVIQTNRFYLVPIENLDQKDSLEALQKATAAEELITSDINCKIDACTLTITHLIKTPGTNRLQIKSRQTLDMLTDSYLQMAATVQSYLAQIFLIPVNSSQKELSEQDYKKLLNLQNSYHSSGERKTILQQLESLQSGIQQLPATQSLYRKIAIDLFFETGEISYINKAENFMSQEKTERSHLSTLLNIFYLKTARGDLISASEILHKIESNQPDDALKYQLYAEIAIEKHEYQSAINYYQKALKLKPAANTYYHLAIAYWYAGSPQESAQQLNKALALSPDYYDALSLSGTISLLDGDITSAINRLEKTYVIKPNDTYNLSNLGLAYLLHHQYEKALELFNKAQEIAPSYSATLLNKADAIDLLGNHTEAVHWYTQLIKLNSIHQEENPSEDQLKEIAQAYAHIGDFSSALDALKQLELKNSQSIETYYSAAIVHTLARNNTSAIFYAENAIKNGMSKVWFNLPWFESLCTSPKFIALIDPNKQDVCAASSN